jgi:hypothetical protein
MPVSFLSTPQRGHYGRYPDSLSSEERVRDCHLDDDDRGGSPPSDALAAAWGGSEGPRADGRRFVAPVRPRHAAPNPQYFNRGRGVTRYNLLSDQCPGRNAITVPGTLRDSLILLAVVLA